MKSHDDPKRLDINDRHSLQRRSLALITPFGGHLILPIWRTYVSMRRLCLNTMSHFTP